MVSNTNHLNKENSITLVCVTLISVLAGNLST